MWTTHAVSARVAHPDEVVGEHWDRRSTEENRRQDWEDGIPKWDVAGAREGERAFNGGGGAEGLGADRAARWASRYSGGVMHPARILGALMVVLALLAWGPRTSGRGSCRPRR
jgi:hypothetical protein